LSVHRSGSNMQGDQGCGAWSCRHAVSLHDDRSVWYLPGSGMDDHFYLSSWI